MANSPAYTRFYEIYTKIWKEYFLEVYYNWDMSYPDEHTAIYHVVFADLRASTEIYEAYFEKSVQIKLYGDIDEEIANRTAYEQVQLELRTAWNEMFQDCKYYGQQPLINKENTK